MTKFAFFGRFTKYSLLAFDEFAFDEVFLEPIARQKRGIAVLICSISKNLLKLLQKFRENVPAHPMDSVRIASDNKRKCGPHASKVS